MHPTAQMPHFAAPSYAKQGNDSFYTFLCFGAAFIFGLIAGIGQFYGLGRWGFAAAILMVSGVNGVLWFGLIKNDYRCFSLKFAFAAFALTQVFPLGVCFTIPLGQDYLFPFREPLYSSPLEAGLSALVRNLCIALVYLCTRPFTRFHGYDLPVRGMLFHTSPRYEWFLIFAAFLDISFWVTITGLDNPLFYLLRIIRSCVKVVPFFVGLTAFRYRKATAVWLVVMALQLGIAFLTGTRGSAFVPIIYFLIGFSIGLPGWSARFRWGFALLPATALLAAAGVYIGSVRDVVGRTDLKGALAEGTMMEKAESGGGINQTSIRVNRAYEVVRRLTLWPDYAVPTMTPEIVPYRGFSDFDRELKGAFSLGIFGLINPNYQGGYYFPNIFLKPYGFAVHIDNYGKKTSNVELPIQVDAFMRGGWFWAFAFTFFGYLILFIIERILKTRLLPRRQPLFLLMVMFLSYIAYSRFRSSPLVECMRQLVLEGTLFFFVCYAYDEGLKRLGKKI